MNMPWQFNDLSAGSQTGIDIRMSGQFSNFGQQGPQSSSILPRIDTPKLLSHMQLFHHDPHPRSRCFRCNFPVFSLACASGGGSLAG